MVAPAWSVDAVPDDDAFTAAPTPRGPAAGTASGSGARGDTTFFVPVVAVSAAARAGEAAATGGGETFGAAAAADAGAGAGVCVAPPLGGIAMGLDTPANVAPARRLDAALAAAAILRATSAALGAADAVAGAAVAAAGVAAAVALAATSAAGLVVETLDAARFTPVVVVVEPPPLPALETPLTVLGGALAPTLAVEVDGDRVFAAASATPAADAAAEVVAAGSASARGTVPTPLVPSIRAGPPGSETPSRISGSSSSPDFEVGSDDAGDSVGTNAVSGRASSPGAPEAVRTSTPRSSNAPCDSKSSVASAKELIESAAATAGAGAAGIEEERPAGSPVPMGSSTGRSARGSKSGREAASIVSSRIRGDQS
jgi:hypothetical protein